MSGRTGRAFATKGHGSLAGSFRAGTGNNQWHPRSPPHVVPISHSLLVDAFIEVTDNERVMAISQILYGQYDTWGMFGIYIKTKVFCRKNNQIHFPMDKGLTAPK